MPRSADRIAGHLFGPAPYGPKRPSSLPPESRQAEEENKEDEGPAVMQIVGRTNVDGVRHLAYGSCFNRSVWAILIAVFVILAAFQIYNQIKMYHDVPVATNIKADYPEKMIFPTIAICNNNQYRLSYITGARIQKRQPTAGVDQPKLTNNSNVFDQALYRAWDMDAVKFLRNAAHWKSRMILKCTYPNQRRCRLSDFKAVWTLTGLCWAINTDPINPIYATRSGPSHSLSLLLNIEKYERIESCTDKFRSIRLPGMKILIYNQTDIPVSSTDGVNVPPGFTMDIPFRVQIRKKFPGQGCLSDKEKKEKREEMSSCALRKYLAEIEHRCGCSMRRAYNPHPNAKYPFCNVQQYFGCVDPVLKSSNSSTFSCKPPCETVDFTAWQDLTLLPDNILPRMLDVSEQLDETDVQDDYEHDYTKDQQDEEDEKETLCSDHLLTEDAANKLKRYAERAYEKRARHQEDMTVKTDRLIARLRHAAAQMEQLKWGWKNEMYLNLYDRLSESVDCYKTIRDEHKDIVAILDTSVVPSDEKIAAHLFKLVDPIEAAKKEDKFEDLSELKTKYGDTVEMINGLSKAVASAVTDVWKLYQKDTFEAQLAKDLDRFDRILELIDQYESGRLERRAWARKMLSRKMRNFYEQDFFEVWYNPTLADLDHKLLRQIHTLQLDELPLLLNASENGTLAEAGAARFFDEMTGQTLTAFALFLTHLHNCTEGELQNKTRDLFKQFKDAIGQFQTAYTDVFKKELPSYLENFEYGDKFIKDNFAMVNVYFHKLSSEHWVQDSTYSMWSLACDVGGALGLFLGASLLTIIELLYLCCQYGFCNRLKFWQYPCWRNMKLPRKTSLPPPVSL